MASYYQISSFILFLIDQDLFTIPVKFIKRSAINVFFFNIKNLFYFDVNIYFINQTISTTLLDKPKLCTWLVGLASQTNLMFFIC